MSIESFYVKPLQWSAGPPGGYSIDRYRAQGVLFLYTIQISIAGSYYCRDPESSQDLTSKSLAEIMQRCESWHQAVAARVFQQWFERTSASRQEPCPEESSQDSFEGVWVSRPQLRERHPLGGSTLTPAKQSSYVPDTEDFGRLTQSVAAAIDLLRDNGYSKAHIRALHAAIRVEMGGRASVVTLPQSEWAGFVSAICRQGGDTGIDNYHMWQAVDGLTVYGVRYSPGSSWQVQLAD